jgi:hypothetical protein
MKVQSYREILAKLLKPIAAATAPRRRGEGTRWKVESGLNQGPLRCKHKLSPIR